MLDNIGFYTLSDSRACTTSVTSPLKRCELILTDSCNFNCPYCRGLKPDISGTKTLKEAKNIVDKWEGLENIRFSGGEPTIWPGLLELVKYTKCKRIAISTNGTADFDFYQELIDRGVNDFSISLDSCCSSMSKTMSGTKQTFFDKIVSNIKKLSKLTYVTVGVVLNENNLSEVLEIINLSDSLGVSDIRVIPSAQYDKFENINIDSVLLNRYPILKYRINHKRHVRGLKKTDCGKCRLVLDDMAVAGNYHFPCIIYMREQGNPIGTMDKSIIEIRQERSKWMERHDSHKDTICCNNCLDVCIDFNNTVEDFQNT